MQQLLKNWQKIKGYKKIAVLRADVDNLGTSFVYGFKRGEDERYVTLSRTAALSRTVVPVFPRDISIKFSRREMKAFSQRADHGMWLLYILEAMMFFWQGHGMK